ncbi:SRSO17 transposase [Acetobacter oeni]|nr:SRSO17 transposase [Acetobacter oeni]
MMSGGASVEETLELWASGLRAARERIAPLFTQKRVVDSACAFLDILIGDEPRKTGWMRAEAAGDPGPWRQQALLGRGHWDADALRDVVRDYVIEHPGTEDGVLVIDETGFLKRGAGVLRCGAAVYGICRQDHELPDWCICHLCISAGPCLC